MGYQFLKRVSQAALCMRCLATVSCVLVLGLGASSATAEQIHRIVIDGPISPASSDYISSAIQSAAAAGSSGLIIELDTPGGLLSSTRTIVKSILAAPIPVLIYVAPGGASATSAGVFITLSAHVAAMAPGTTIGAAHPVGSGGGDIQGDMRKKVENYAVSFVESIAGRRGRNIEWAQSAVRESVSITETEAVALEVVDLVAADIGELLERSLGIEVEVAGEKRLLDFSRIDASPGSSDIVDIDMTLRQRVLNVITDPNIAYLLMMAGMLGLYMEFSNPGVVFPGVAGVICLLLALLAGQVLPISSTGVLLIVVGMGFLFAEVFLPSFGILGFGGLVALTLGSLFLYTPESNLIVDRSLITITIVLFSVAAAVVVLLLLRDRRRPPATGAEGLVGQLGVAVTAVHAAGKVQVHGEFWNATSAEPLERNCRVRVVGVDGLTLRVAPQEE